MRAHLLDILYILLVALACIAPFITIHFVWKYVKKGGSTKTILGIAAGLSLSLLFLILLCVIVYLNGPG
jgi:hypothetical protein